MTKKKKMRDSSEYPALNKNLNLKSRKDYVETDYIDGVKDKDGNIVIRPLTDKEKKFLNDFYEETIITNFNHDPRLKELSKKKKKIIIDDNIKELQKELKKLKLDKKKNEKRISEIKEIIKLTKKSNEETYSDKIEQIEKKMSKIRKETLLYPDKEDHKQFYKNNNSRNNCIFNKSKTINGLISLNSEKYDYYTAEKVQGFDYEDEIIEEIEKKDSENKSTREDEVHRKIARDIESKQFWKK